MKDDDFSGAWPAHTFIRQTMYRRLGLGKDVRITDKGITIRIMRNGQYKFIDRTWQQLYKLRSK